ncbi:cell division protein ZapE [Pseudoalteromonas denitrificans]|uniref:Cell division protein ZapE n=1 Tax=Pseudoalteromonas denitrificans DSM 6059 TaxID=1123010 RepID=A0A1I1QNG1_9GAMM|nr:cell division protein ZapE [Pseudoalteromonas denitrificans]SFD19600.1 cell division protein ZapE [Pseudoalteromonas denitrificans DSM 6059]
MALSPQKIYQDKVKQTNFVADAQQIIAVKKLENLYQNLKKTELKQPKGIYLWGDVGRGKTFLMDLFFDSLTDDKKLRLHFHHFMAKIHTELHVASGHKNPLKIIAKKLSKQCRVLCFDEFFVSDIGDAMILGRLFEALFEQGITLVATSNIPINRLYENGLQRQQFLPTIDLLNQYTDELHLNGVQDHRLHHLNFAQTYFLSTEDLTAVFNKARNEKTVLKNNIRILGREIETVAHVNDTAWFTFDAVCNGPRSQLDYIELAKKYKNIFLSEVPKLGGQCRSWIKARGTEDGVEATITGERQLSYATQDDAARRFISLIDELYDQNTNVYICAEVPLNELYGGGALSFEFKRTFSRLSQMQSIEYLNQS